MDAQTIKESVREHYGKVANSKAGCGCGPAGGCCGSAAAPVGEIAETIGYTRQDTAFVPEGANLGLGCGNPRAIASLKPGETVLDLGSGAGFDCFLAAGEVGPAGKVIGVDMTPEMLSKAKENLKKAEARAFQNVEFRLGEIEHLPVADGSVDVVISNCVINLSAEKEKVFKEVYRVLKPGGRLAILDVLAVGPIPESVRNNLAAISVCVGGAENVDQIKRILGVARFENIRVNVLEESRHAIDQWFPGLNAGSYVRSATIEAWKPSVGGADRISACAKRERIENKEIRQRVYKDFESGQHCAEAVSKTVLGIFSSQPASAAVACAAGFGGGVAGTFEEVCGAFSGGVIALGTLLGRSQPAVNRKALGELTRQFRERFLSEFGSTHCGTLKKGFSEKQGPMGCVRLSAQAAVMLIDLVYRFEAENNAPVEMWTQEHFENASPGNCPFRADGMAISG